MPAALCMEPSDRLQHAPLFGADHRVVGKALYGGMTATATEAGGIACHRPLGLARHTRPTASDTGVQKATRSHRPLAHDQSQPLGFWVAAVLHGFAGPFVHGLWSARFRRRSCASPQRLARCARWSQTRPCNHPPHTGQSQRPIYTHFHATLATNASARRTLLGLALAQAKAQAAQGDKTTVSRSNFAGYRYGPQ